MAGQEDRGMTRDTDLNGLRVLVAEDRGLVAAKIGQVLRKAGCVVAGPVGTLSAGLGFVRQRGGMLDAAVLDIDLHGEAVFPLAEALRACDVPFLFLTGYGAPLVPGPWRNIARIEKPFSAAALLAALASVLADQAVPPAGPEPAPVSPSLVVRRSWESIRRSRDLLIESRFLHERWQRDGKP